MHIIPFLFCNVLEIRKPDCISFYLYMHFWKISWQLTLDRIANLNVNVFFFLKCRKTLVSFGLCCLSKGIGNLIWTKYKGNSLDSSSGYMQKKKCWKILTFSFILLDNCKIFQWLKQKQCVNLTGVAFWLRMCNIWNMTGNIFNSCDHFLGLTVNLNKWQLDLNNEKLFHIVWQAE